MQTKLRKFLRVLRIEIEDMEGDLQALIELYKERKDSKDITNYVYLENKSLLISELHCLANLLDSLNDVDATRYETVDVMIDDLERMIAERAVACAFPEVISRLVARKIAKVRRYVLAEDPHGIQAPGDPTPGPQETS
jgi:hypothetical protein